MAAPAVHPAADEGGAEGLSGTRVTTLQRFDRAERVAHWANSFLFLVLVLTGLALYSSAVMGLVGRRRLVIDIHLAAGLALPLPLFASLAGRWGAQLRADLGRINRWTPGDRTWMRAAFSGRDRRQALRQDLVDGKFNAGQKLNTAFTGGAIGVMLLSGVVMYWFHPWPLSWRTGATYTHDWLAAALLVVIAGHISYALRDFESMRSMLTGRVPRWWAQRHAPAWLAEVEAGTPGGVTTGPAPR
jgi:formate dehydrogenase subunit gamma